MSLVRIPRPHGRFGPLGGRAGRVAGRIAATARRLRPTPRSVLAAIRLPVGVVDSAGREFVWAELRDGRIDSRGLSVAARGLVGLGFGLFFLLVGALLLSDLWRAQSPLFHLASGSPGRARSLPILLLPATLFLLAIAWSFILTGALHSHPAIRLGVLLPYLLVALAWFQATIGLAQYGDFARLVTGVVGQLLRAQADPEAMLALGAILAVPLIFVLRWRAAARPGLEFAAMLLPVAATLALSQERGLVVWRTLGVPLTFVQIDDIVKSLGLLLSPLLLFIGIDMAIFATRLARWAAVTASTRVAPSRPGLLLALLLAWQVGAVGLEALASFRAGEPVPRYAGALPLLVAAGLWWLVATRRGAGPGLPGLTAEAVTATAQKHGWPLILVFSALSLGLGIFEPLRKVLTASPARPLAGIGAAVAGDVGDAWHSLVAVLAVVAAAWLARRDRPAPALYLGLFGTTQLWSQVTRPGRPLAIVGGDRIEAVSAWAVILLAVVAGVWLARGRLTRARVERLLFLAVIAILVRQVDFLENPFTPFLGFAGVAFIVFGLTWDALTVGSWANVGSAALPRASRIFLYLGYVLLTVTVVNWALATRDLDWVGFFTGELAINGFLGFGMPLLYAVFAATLALPPGGDAPVASGSADRPPRPSGTSPGRAASGATNAR